MTFPYEYEMVLSQSGHLSDIMIVEPVITIVSRRCVTFIANQGPSISNPRLVWSVRGKNW